MKLNVCPCVCPIIGVKSMRAAKNGIGHSLQKFILKKISPKIFCFEADQKIKNGFKAQQEDPDAHVKKFSSIKD